VNTFVLADPYFCFWKQISGFYGINKRWG